jgi:hypothetical protein
MAIPLALIGMAADAGMKAQTAYSQDRQRKQLQAAAKVRPILGIPTALQEKANLAKNMANSSLLPAQGYYENQLGASTSRANREIQNTGGSASDVIAGLTQVDANNRNQLSALAAAGAENQQQNKASYGNTLSEVAGQQNEMFDYNQNQPYQSQQLKIQSLRDSSNRNLNNAISSGIDLASNYDTGKQMDDVYGTNYYGGNRQVGARAPRSSRSASGAPSAPNAPQQYSPMFNNTNLGMAPIQ